MNKKNYHLFPNMKKRVVLFGSSAPLKHSYKIEIQKLGRLLAQNSFAVISGGYGGAMEDISRGAKEGGGQHIGGILCSLFTQREKNYFLTAWKSFPTYTERFYRLSKEADVFVVAPGAMGTLGELFTTMARQKTREITGPPILFTNWWKPVIKLFTSSAIEPFPSLEALPHAENADKAMNWILEQYEEGKRKLKVRC